ncbi:hypothetical protein J0X19_14590 [Hymenobacter sp. BT186]|uniref:Uncharacterized protein n=1 Tax=Hymenobacter telluris TaxID=2816474 RepID=A0A939JBI8_9BACT|nr:hypothetical protein [Hymenobacter telluris]MBO0359186.1 hypothetical protein [Hymenobacter telluris]MBW3375212.1 hypothetical protein [Hymenobacter norwichensis]
MAEGNDGFYAGRINDTTRTQVDVLLTAYPLGAARLYTFGRGSLVTSNGRTFPNALLGAGGRCTPVFRWRRL